MTLGAKTYSLSVHTIILCFMSKKKYMPSSVLHSLQEYMYVAGNLWTCTKVPGIVTWYTLSSTSSSALSAVLVPNYNESTNPQRRIEESMHGCALPPEPCPHCV